MGLSPVTLDRIRDCFRNHEREEAIRIIEEGSCAFASLVEIERKDLERLHVAAIKVSRGNLDRLREAADLSKIDYRDLLVAAGFEHDIGAHLTWKAGANVAHGFDLRSQNCSLIRWCFIASNALLISFAIILISAAFLNATGELLRVFDIAAKAVGVALIINILVVWYLTVCYFLRDRRSPLTRNDSIIALSAIFIPVFTIYLLRRALKEE